MSNEHKPSILIGNGFNMALQKHISKAKICLDYHSIFNETLTRLKNTDSHHSHLCEFLEKAEKNKQYDLEYLLMILKNSEECFKFSTKNYCTLTKDCTQLLNEDKKLLRKSVIEILTDFNFHPQYEVIFNLESSKTYSIAQK